MFNCSVGDFKKAIAAFSEVIKLDPENIEAYYSRRYAYKKIEDDEKAEVFE